jgi:hypothetical protein
LLKFGFSSLAWKEQNFNFPTPTSIEDTSLKVVPNANHIDAEVLEIPR